MISDGLGTAGIIAVPIPPNGAPGTVLTKLTAADYDTYWGPGGGGGAVWGGITGDINSQTDLIALIARSVGAGMGAAMSFMEDGAVEDSYFAPGTSSGTGSVGPTGPAGPPGPAVLMSLDDIDVEPAPMVPGTPGAAGTNGAQGSPGLQIFLQADDLDTEPAPMVPGTPGVAGTNGSTGPAGLSIMLSLDDVDVEAAPVIPGSAGTAGTAGTNGAVGPAVYLEAEPGEDGLTIPGPQGIQGPAGGGGGGSATEVEVDFGSTPVWDALFSVIDAAISATSKILISESGKAATGRATGDAQWDSISPAALPAAGSMQVYCLATPGPVVGKRKLQYAVMA